MYIAHIRQIDGAKQSLKTHLEETARLASDNLRSLGLPTLGYLAGLLHDAGKYSDEFQEYIKAAASGEAVIRGKVDHSTAGGQLILALTPDTLTRENRYIKFAAELIANAIFAHHRREGLLDFISGEQGASSPFFERSQKVIENQQLVRARFEEEIGSIGQLQELLLTAENELMTLAAKHHDRIDKASQFFLLKSVYSALLDGDRRNTQQFESGVVENRLDASEVFTRMGEALEETFARFQNGKQTSINELRQVMADACLSAAARPTGIYKLSIPTGGGKTLSSMRFALNHALKTGKRRIIYIIPFSSIIEQNAAVFREELHDVEHILEHHANLILEEDDEGIASERKQALLQDNWDSPVIVTTMVRFLENVFASSTRNPRRIHQLLDSVLVFDEIQSLPPKCLSMFNKLITFLKEYGHTTTLLCTATQPTLEKRKVALAVAADGEIVPDLERVSEAFERVTVVDKTKKEGWQADEIADFCRKILKKEQNLLVILNTKKAVKAVYEKLAETEEHLFHLSTSMTPNHRTIVLERIKERLAAGKRVICVTTPLIEAGVDVSFASVIRSVAGLDAIAQAAGRCNRHGESATLQPVYLVNPVKEVENIDRMSEIKTKIQITKEMLRDRQYQETEESLLAPRLMEVFFEKFYRRIEETGETEYLCNQGRTKLFDLMMNNVDRRNFYIKMTDRKIATFQMSSPATIAKHFKVIQEEGESVLVEWGEGQKIVADLLGDEAIIFDRKWWQKAQRNSITLYRHQFQTLASEGLITRSDAGVYILIAQAYDERFGLNIAGDSQGDFFF